jgi:hypothetical protein
MLENYLPHKGFGKSMGREFSVGACIAPMSAHLVGAIRASESVFTISASCTFLVSLVLLPIRRNKAPRPKVRRQLQVNNRDLRGLSLILYVLLCIHGIMDRDLQGLCLTCARAGQVSISYLDRDMVDKKKNYEQENSKRQCTTGESNPVSPDNLVRCPRLGSGCSAHDWCVLPLVPSR